MDLVRGLPDAPLSSSSDDNDEPDESILLRHNRHVCQVGTKLELRNFSADCVGHDMTWKGSLLTRVVALQTGGTGRNRHQWGRWWGQRLLELKADIGILAETSLAGPDQHAAALHGLYSAGYVALSHSAHSAAREVCSLSRQHAAGVVIAVHRSVASNWVDVSRDERGRGVSACLLLANGGRLRVVGLYGPTGGNLPNFVHSPENLAAEASLKAFLTQEERKAAMAGDAVVVGGDLNSVVSRTLDTWAGSYIDRADCVARHLASMGLTDVFRAFHPETRAFTFYSSASASRLDSIWYLPAPAWAAGPVNSTILWQWCYRTDHEPVLVDFRFQLPAIYSSLPMPFPKWRVLTTMLGAPDAARTRQQVQRKLENHMASIQAISDRLLEAEALLDAMPQAPCEGVTGLWNEMLPSSTASATCLRAIVDSNFSELQALLLSCLPDVVAGPSRRIAKASEAWHQCILELRRIRQYLQDFAANPYRQLDVSKVSLQQASSLASKAIAILRLGQTRTDRAGASVPWDSLHTNLEEWVGTLGVPEFCRLECADVLLGSQRFSSPCSSTRGPTSIVLPLLWPVNPSTMDRRRVPTLILQVTEWLDRVQQLYSSCTGKQSRSYLQERRNRLRAGDVKGWAKWMRPLPHPRSEYLPDWCVREDGVACRPTSVSEVLRGAEQEWGTLLKEPADSWSHTLISHYQDSAGRKRGMLDFVAVMASQGNDDLRRVGRALLCPGPWLLLPWRRVQLRIWSDHCVVVAGWVLHWDGWAWVGCRPSGWKLAFLDFYPDHVQQLYWRSIDFQRRSGIVASTLKEALQVHLSKASGGWRPLSLMEEGFKAIEGPLNQRLAATIQQDKDGELYSLLNMGYAPGYPAAPHVLYLDALLLEDAARHRRPISRVAVDYEKFFNTLQLVELDAVQHCRGIPDAARAVYQDLFGACAVRLATRLGVTSPVAVSRGVPQGSVSSPSLSRSAQEPLLRLRENSLHGYRTSGGRLVQTCGFVDDLEHYGSGVSDLTGISDSLALGSACSGVGFSWKKCRAFASDWEERQEYAGPRVQAQGLALSSWDIWSGGFKQVVIPRALPDEEEVLLGKRGTLGDKHSLAIEDLLKSMRRATQRIAFKRCSWDEATALMQWIVGGILSYAPLIGIPPAEDVHTEDLAFQRLLLNTVGSRSTAERASLLAPKAFGGLGAPCLVELLLSSVASGVLLLLNGTSQVALIARDTLKQAFESPPSQLDCQDGTLLRALKLLAGYGLYVEVSTDRMVGRILDCIAGERAMKQPFTAAFQPDSYARGQVYCRVGSAANSIRCAWSLIRAGAPVQDWFSAECWAEHLDLACPFHPSTCARAARQASAQADSDWQIECSIFQPGAGVPLLPEDWPAASWEHATGRPDARTAFLMAQSQCPQLEGWDFAMFGDGGQTSHDCTTYSYQARSFGPLGDYWGTSYAVSQRQVGRLPVRIGWENSGVHEAELAAMLGSLRYRRSRDWMLLVADRSALFHILNKVSEGDEAVLLKQRCQPWVTRLWHILRERAAIWKPDVQTPSWRLQQVELPSAWNIQLPDAEASTSRWFSRIAFSRFGLVGVDIKSHQTLSALPHPVLVQGNQLQDEGCAEARAHPSLPDLRRPVGGTFAYLVCQGRSVTSPARDLIRNLMRQEALSSWASKPVQGLIAHVSHEIFKPCLNPDLYKHWQIPARWRRWALPQDDLQVDLTPMLFRCTRSIGGSWTERLHSSADLQRLGHRHVLMSCVHMSPLVDALRDSVEAALTELQSPDFLIAAACAWRSRTEYLVPGVPSPRDVSRWPVLSAWRWLVSFPEREAYLSEEPRGSSRDCSHRAKGHDLAYRGVLPLALGKALCSLHHAANVDHLLPAEIFATLRQPGQATAEAATSHSRASRIQPAVVVSSLLLLGLRFVRSEFQQRLDAWIALAGTLLDHMQPAGVPQEASCRFTAASKTSHVSAMASSTPLVRLENGLPDVPADKKMPPNFFLILIPITFAMGQVFAWPIYLFGDRKAYDAKIDILATYNLGWLYLSLFVVYYTKQFVSQQASMERNAASVMLPNQSVHKVMVKEGATALPYVLLEETGPVGRANRAQRGFENLMEYLPMYLAYLFANGFVYPFPAFVNACVFLFARVKYARDYTVSTEARQGGFMLYGFAQDLVAFCKGLHGGLAADCRRQSPDACLEADHPPSRDL
eukprot:s232_g7.t1